MKLKTIILACLLSSSICLAHAATPLLLFGGSSHHTFLGCINCNKMDSGSIWNNYGEYGSRYSSNSIWNNYGEFGSSYSSYSPWNRYASYPPVIVDSDGKFYGYLTANEYHSKRSNLSLANILVKYHSQIQSDISEWYEKIFE